MTTGRAFTEALTLSVSEEDLDYLTSYNLSLCGVADTEVLNTTIIGNQSAGTLCSLGEIKEDYLSIHGQLAMVVCIFGTLFNVANILVLTHRDMKMNPINMILTGIAVADCLVMVEYIPFTIHMYLLKNWDRDQEEEFSLAWGYFLLFHTNFSIMIHTVSIWLTLSLAFWRLIMIKFSTLAITMCTLSRCKAVLTLGFAVPLLLTIPNLLSHQAMKDDGSCVTLYTLQIINKSVFSLNMWLYSFFLKLLPCLVLTILTTCLIRALYKVEENSHNLRQGSQLNIHSKNTDKTTKLLSIILIFFLTAELPQGILGMLSAIFGQQFFLECYNPVGEMMDMMALINSSANYILYCLMSSDFRQTLRKLSGLEDKTVKATVTITTKYEKYPVLKRDLIARGGQAQQLADTTAL